MAEASWPSDAEVNEMRNLVSSMAGRDPSEVRVVVSPYRICPLGAHIDHQFRLIENEYLGLKNGILDQSSILLSSRGCLTHMNCKVKIDYLPFSMTVFGSKIIFIYAQR
ncbi:hypothetical protein LINPERPRIM_LOCUS21007 [Linum perenne]